MNPSAQNIQLKTKGDLWAGYFEAMACLCEILVDTTDEKLALHLTQIAQQEALRIQHKFSRYQKDNIVWQINNAQGKPVSVDAETALLLDFAEQCYQLSDGFFDITSGCLRRAWAFDGSDKIPTQTQIDAVREHIGWNKVHWNKPELQMPAGMEIDFGGSGKEYAVDRALLLIREQSDAPVLVNFGGDLAVTGARLSGNAWDVGIETPDKQRESQALLAISAGALATSGDSRRYLLRDGIRYSHILNPFTGWPIAHAPRSITVAGSNCVQAGMLATFGLLQGENAEQFLQEQGVAFWCLR